MNRRREGEELKGVKKMRTGLILDPRNKLAFLDPLSFLSAHATEVTVNPALFTLEIGRVVFSSFSRVLRSVCWSVGRSVRR